MQEGILYRRFEEGSGRSYHLQLVIPRRLQEEVLEEAHAGTMSCHLGEDKTFARLREKFFWPRYSNAVKNGVKPVSIVLLESHRHVNAEDHSKTY